MKRDLKYVSLGVGFLAAILVFSMAATGAIIIDVSALSQSGDSGGGSSSGGGSAGGNSTMITNAQMQLAQAMTALKSKNTTGAMMHLNLLNQSLTTLSIGAGGVMATSVGGGSTGPSVGGGSTGPSVGGGSTGGGSSVGGHGSSGP